MPRDLKLQESITEFEFYDAKLWIDTTPEAERKLHEYAEIRDAYTTAVSEGLDYTAGHHAQKLVEWAERNGVEPHEAYVSRAVDHDFRYAGREDFTAPVESMPYVASDETIRQMGSMADRSGHVYTVAAFEKVLFEHSLARDEALLDRELDSATRGELRDARLLLDLANSSSYELSQFEASVPPELRGEASYTSSTNEYNSLDNVREYAQILAIDKNGNALMRETTHWEYPDADNTSFSVMPVAEAKAMLESYRENDREFQAHERGEFWYHETREHAEPGRTYTGPILEVNDKTVLQQAAGKVIEHDRKALVGTHKFDGKQIGDIEIRYPHGTIGIAREAKQTHELKPREHEKQGQSMSMER
jgi:hypothetical protein